MQNTSKLEKIGAINELPKIINNINLMLILLQQQIDTNKQRLILELKKQIPQIIFRNQINTKLGLKNLQIDFYDFDITQRLETKKSVNSPKNYPNQYWYFEPIGLSGTCIYLRLEFSCFDKEEGLELIIPTSPEQPIYLLDLFLTSDQEYFKGTGLGSFAIKNIVLPFANSLNKNVLLAILRPKEIDYKVIYGSLPKEVFTQKMQSYINNFNLKGEKRKRAEEYLNLKNFYTKHNFRTIREN